MPGYILHLLHGDMILKQSKLYCTKKDINQFRMGLLLPDVNKSLHLEDDNSHFYSPSQRGLLIRTPDFKRFPYLLQLDNPLVMGYAAHLYLDKMFFEDYFQRFVAFYDMNGNRTLEKEKAWRVELLISRESVSVNDFFSDEYLYGDYTFLNHYLIDKYKIDRIQTVSVENPIAEVNVASFCVVKDALDQYLDKSLNQTAMKVFTLDSLEKTIEQYAFGFWQWSDGALNVLEQLKGG